MLISFLLLCQQSLNAPVNGNQKNGKGGEEDAGGLGGARELAQNLLVAAIVGNQSGWWRTFSVVVVISAKYIVCTDIAFECVT